MVRSTVAQVVGSLLVALALIGTSCAKAAPCEFNGDCAVGFYCSAGVCKRDCADGLDCDPGLVCGVVGKCVPADGGVLADASTKDGAGDAAEDVTLRDGAVPDGAVPDGAVPDGPVPDGAAPRQKLDLCASDAECGPAALCRPLYRGGPQRCTPVCTTSAQCWSGARCLTLGSETYCAASDVGRPCDVGAPAAACNAYCVSPGYCTIECGSGAGCPNGYGCGSVAGKRVCVKAEEYCGAGAMCTGAQCDTGILASGCTFGCASASDCPQRALPLAPWTCAGGSCRRPADVKGPLPQGSPAEYACDVNNAVVNLCNDTQHIDFAQFTIPAAPRVVCPSAVSVAGVPGDSCVNSCRYAGGCIHGYACTGVGSLGGQRVGLCLPALGSGEVRAACSRDGDCAFGYCAQGKCSRDCSADGVCPTGSTCSAGGAPDVEGVPFRRCQ